MRKAAGRAGSRAGGSIATSLSTGQPRRRARRISRRSRKWSVGGGWSGARGVQMTLMVVTRGQEVAPERPARYLAGELEARAGRPAVVKARPHACVGDRALEVVDSVECVGSRPVIRGTVGGASDGDVNVVCSQHDG